MLNIIKKTAAPFVIYIKIYFLLVYPISVGCLKVIHRSETLLYINTSYYVGVGRNDERAVGSQTESDDDDDDDDDDNAAALWSLPPFQIIQVCQEGLVSVNQTVRETDKTETKIVESKSCRPGEKEETAFAAEKKVEIWEFREENGKQSGEPAGQGASIGDEKRKEISKGKTADHFEAVYADHFSTTSQNNTCRFLCCLADHL